MVKVYVAIDEPKVLIYMVIYATKRKNKYINQMLIIKKLVYWN